MQNRFKSPIMWGAVLAQLTIIAGLFFAPEIIEKIGIIGMAAIEILTLVGILNNPTDSQHF